VLRAVKSAEDHFPRRAASSSEARRFPVSSKNLRKLWATLGRINRESRFLMRVDCETAFLVLITLITGTRDYIGIGKDVIHRAITGSNDLGILAFLIKTLTVSITLGSGGSGGILTPIFYIGATAGYSWGHLVQGNIELYSAVGIVAFLAAAINTPLAAIVMAIEMFGLNVGVYATVACAVSYIIVGHRSALPSQILAISKTPSIDLDDLDCELSQHKTFTVITKH